MLLKRGKVYSSRLMISRRTVQKSLKTRDRQEAMRREAQWRIELTSEEFGLHSPSSFTLRQFEEKFISHVTPRVTEGTLSFYRNAYKALNTTLGDTRLARIDQQAVDEFVAKRLEAVSRTSTNNDLMTLRRILHVAAKLKYIKQAPKIALLKNDARREFVITPEVKKAMLAHEKCTPCLKVLIPFLLDTGLRIREALALEWSNVSMAEKTITVTKGKTPAARRTIPMNKEVFRILSAMRRGVAKHAEDGTVFHRCRGYTNIWTQFDKLRTALDLPDDCVIHSTRHSFCTRLGAKGVDAFTIQKLAGHSNISVSARYVHPVTETLKKAIEKI